MNIMLKIGERDHHAGARRHHPGRVTRDSVLTLDARVEAARAERPVRSTEVREAASKVTLKESGARAPPVISPVGELAFQRDRIVVNGADR